MKLWDKHMKIGVIATSAAVIVAGSVAGALVYLLNDNSEEEVAEQHSVGPLLEYNFEYKDDHGNVMDKVEGLKIKQFKTRTPDLEESYVNSKGEFVLHYKYDYFLDNTGMNYLVQKFLKKGIYGPELYNLKNIYIGNVDWTKDNAEGVYFPTTNEIGLDTRTYATVLATRYLKASLDRRNPNNAAILKILNDHDLLQKLKAEMIFEVLFHEYGHHIAHSYMSSPYPSTGNYTTNIWRHGENYKARNAWNKSFINSFKSNLNYDKHTQKYPAIKDSRGNYSIGTAYDAKDLYDFANSESGIIPEHPIYKNLSYGATGSFIDNGSVLQYNRTIQKLSNFTYLYSMEELFTRRYLTLCLRAESDFNDLVKLSYPTGLMEEADSTETLMSLPQAGATYKAERFLQDNVFEPSNSFLNASYNRQNEPQTGVAQNLADSLLSAWGQKDGADLSWMTFKNTWKLDQVESDKITNDSNDKNAILNEGRKIKFGGFITAAEASSYNYVGYMDNGVFHGLPIIKHQFQFGHKTKMFDNNWITPSGTDTHFYTLKDWVNADEIKDKTLYFGRTANDAHPINLKTIKWNNEGKASSFRSLAPQSLGSLPIYKAVHSIDAHNHADVRIKESGLTMKVGENEEA